MTTCGSGIDAARDRRLGDALHGEAVRGDAHRHARAARAVSHVSSNARLTMSFSFAFTSASFQKYSWRPCTHSKYETTTPPAFASTSGRIEHALVLEDRVGGRRDRAVRALADDRRLHLGRRSRSVITCSSAHGASTSTSSSSSSSFVIASASRGPRACRARACARTRPARRCPSRCGAPSSSRRSRRPSRPPRARNFAR